MEEILKAYMLAQQREPSSRLSEGDIQRAKMQIPADTTGGKFSSIFESIMKQKGEKQTGGVLGAVAGTIKRDQEFLNMLMNDVEGKVDDETKDFYYKTIIPRLFKAAQTDAEKRRLIMLANELGVDAFATGGRVGYQTGGVTEQRTLPPEFVEAAQKTFLTDLSRQAGIPTITTAVQQQPGETAEQFANRQAQAQQFQITRAGMAELAPQVAAQDTLQTAARTQAVDPTTGLGAFQPFLTKAADAATAATALTGTGVPLPAGVQAGSIEAYTSPFQQQVIDTTLAEFDRQKQIQQNQLAARTLGVAGAFGGGREGVQRAEFDAASDMNRARLLADLRQRGFQQAATARQQDLANQMGISQLQSGLGGAAQDFARAQISGLGTLGAAEQAQQQAILDANRQAATARQQDLANQMGIAQLQSGLGGAAQDFARAQISGLGTLGAAQQAQTQAEIDAARQAAAMAVQDPRDRLGMFGTGIAQITPGAGGVRLEPTAATAAGPSPLMQALGVGLAGADIYGRIFGGKR